MKKIFSEDEKLFLRSMGKALKVTAIFTDVSECNNYCLKSNDGVIAEFEPFIFCADLNDKGKVGAR